jgi:methylated-DNA-[protein]-cysteine S-methyltransferase
MTFWLSSFVSPVGELTVVVDGEGAVKSLQFGRLAPQAMIRDAAAIAPVRTQIEQYFAGERREFDLDLAPDGTSFQRAVWRGLLAIPFGDTLSYGALAARIGHSGAFRAVGAANGANPIAIIIPCHRVIGGDGQLTGFGGGIPIKAALLAHEGVLSRAAAMKADRRTRIGVSRPVAATLPGIDFGASAR